MAVAFFVNSNDAAVFVTRLCDGSSPLYFFISFLRWSVWVVLRTRIWVYISGSCTSVKTFSRAFQTVFYQGRDGSQFFPWTTTARQFALGEGGGVVTGCSSFFLFFILFMIVLPFWPAIRWVTLLLLISCGFSDCLSRAGLGGPQTEFGKNTIFCKSSHFSEIGSCRNNYCHCFQIEKHNAEKVLRHEIKSIVFLR